MANDIVNEIMRTNQGVLCPVCGGTIPPEEDDAVVWPEHLDTYQPDGPEPERDEFGPLTSKTRLVDMPY